MSTLSDSLPQNATRRDESDRDGKIMKMGRQNKTPAGSYPAPAAGPSTSPERVLACWVSGGFRSDPGMSRARTGISPCTGQLKRVVRCSCVGLLGVRDRAGATAGLRGAGTQGPTEPTPDTGHQWEAMGNAAGGGFGRHPFEKGGRGERQ